VNRSASRSLSVGLMALLAACGEAPAAASAPAVLQHVPFTAVGDPATGRFQIVTSPQPVLVPIAQDGNGNAGTVDSAKVQIYSPTANFASAGVGYPPGCSTSSPYVMFADVEAFSGFNEQLRNVYVRITSVSSGQTFCGASASIGNFGSSLNPNLFLYLYEPLDKGTGSFDLVRRSLTWGVLLPSNAPFWFDGEVWAEIVPALPTITNPADGHIFHGGQSKTDVAFAWLEDLTANGSTPAGSVVAMPKGAGSEVTVWQCNAAAQAFDATTCGTPLVNRVVRTTLSWSGKLSTGFWYQWSLRPVFTLPGDSAKTSGTQVITRTFKTVFP